jgi:hypothetical protein
MPPVRVPPSANRRSPRQSADDGTSTVSSTATTATRSAAANIVQSNATASPHSPIGSAPASMRNPAAASAAPASPAATPSTSASSTICCVRRVRLAPSAARTDISVVRRSTWPSMSAATLAQAMSRMSPIATNVATSAGRIPPSSASRIGVTAAFFVLSHFSLYWNCSPSVFVSCASGAARLCTSCPGATRPTSVKLPFCRCGSMANGAQSRTRGSGNQKPRGITPTTVRGAPSSMSRVPRTDGLPPSSCQSP